MERNLERGQQLYELVEDFCKKKLDEEYFELAKRLIHKMRSDEESFRMTGKEKAWAAAVIHAIGTINYLFDKSFEPYVSVDDINIFFGTSRSTTALKSKKIRDFYNIAQWDSEFSTKKMQEMNPFTQFVMINGKIVSVNSLPEKYQQLIMKARAEGKEISFTIFDI